MTGTTVAIFGVGAVGSRVAAGLVERTDWSVRLFDASAAAADAVAARHGDRVVSDHDLRVAIDNSDVVVVAAPEVTQVSIVRLAIRMGRAVVSTADAIDDLVAIKALGPEAELRGVPVLVGAGFAPGLSCVLARHGALRFDIVDEVHVAKQGTGGPACARTHHRALGRPARDWRDGRFVERPGGSGRELVWFPEPVRGADCYRAALGDSTLLQPEFPEAQRITSRMAATRRDRFTAWLPMLLPPHADGGMGAVRVELRGRVDGAREITVTGAAAPPSSATAAVVVASLDALTTARPGVYGLAGLDHTDRLLAAIAGQGISLVEFAGSAD